MKINALLLTLLLIVSSNVEADDYTKTVKFFVSAFNAKNIDDMLSATTPDVQWMSVAGHTLSIETRNQVSLKASMQGYFNSVPSARSTIEQIRQSGPFVYTLERASWESKGVTAAQCSMAVYEFAEDKIKHVWYFASHECI